MCIRALIWWLLATHLQRNISARLYRLTSFWVYQVNKLRNLYAVINLPSLQKRRYVVIFYSFIIHEVIQRSNLYAQSDRKRNIKRNYWEHPKSQVTLRSPSPSARVWNDEERAYGDIITKFSRIDGLPIFPLNGPSLVRLSAEAPQIITVKSWITAVKDLESWPSERWPVLK